MYVCPGEPVVYTCTASQFEPGGILLTWFIDNDELNAFTSLANDTVGETRSSRNFPGVIAILREVTSSEFVSTLLIDSAEVVPDHTRIRCGGFGNVEDYPELFLKISSKPSPPTNVKVVSTPNRKVYW